MPAMASSGQGSVPLNAQLLVDSIPALIHTARPDGYLDYFNKPWLEYLGVTLDKVTGWNWTTVVHPEDVEGIEAAIGAARAQAARQSLGRVAEQRVTGTNCCGPRTGQRVVGIAEVWVVEDVEELRTEAQPQLLGQVKLPLQPHIRLRGFETAKNVAPKVSLLQVSLRSFRRL